MNDIKKISPALEIAWEIRYKTRIIANKKLQESAEYKKKAELKKNEWIATKKKIHSMTPWKAKGLVIRNLGLRKEIEELYKKQTDTSKEAKNIFLKSDNEWITEVKRVCGDININWIKTETEGRACRLDNGLYFSSHDVANKLKSSYNMR